MSGSKELDARVAAIWADTSRRLSAVPFADRAGDWDAVAAAHRAMLAVLHDGREALGRLEAPPDCAATYREYLQAVDRQLVEEERRVHAAEAADLSAYHATGQSVVAAARATEAVARRAGLRSVRRTLRQRIHVWWMLPWVATKAQAHAWREQREGRSWEAAPRRAAMPSAWLFLIALVATFAVDHALKALARSQYPEAVTMHAVDPGSPLVPILLFLLTLRFTAVRPQSWAWVYGAGLGWGGAFANMAELELRGAATNFIHVGSHVANPADVALVVGGALWWCAAVAQMVVAVRGARRAASSAPAA